MTDKKISELTALTTADDADLLPIVDVSAGETKHITKADLFDDLTIDITANGLTHGIQPITPDEAVGFFDGDPTLAGEFGAIGLFTAADGSGFYDLYAQDASGGFVDISAFQAGQIDVSASARFQAAVAGNSLLVQDDGVDLHTAGSDSVTLQTDSIRIVSTVGEVRLQGAQIIIVLSSLPTSDPGVAGQLFTSGAPSAGTPKNLQISGG